MKRRRGFVANSSSSSFCIFGVQVYKEDIQNLSGGKANDRMRAEGFINEFGLELHTVGYDGYEYYIGRSWKSIRDNETGSSFKESVKTSIKTLFGKEMACGTKQEAWYNG